MKQLKTAGKILGIFIITIAILAVLAVLGFNIYQRVICAEFVSVSQKEFEIPGLSDKYVPQGLDFAFDEQTGLYYLSCGYMSDGTASRIYYAKDSGDSRDLSFKYVSLYTENSEPDLAHAGGIAVYGDFVYLATGEEINVYSLKALLSAKSGGQLKPIGVFNPETGPAFVHVEGNLLYVGEFYIAEDYETPESHHMTTDIGDFHQAVMTVFRLDENAELGLTSTIPEFAYSITDNAQGMCFAEGKILISTSYGLSTSHVKVYDDPAVGEADSIFVSDSGDEIPLYYLDSAHLDKTWSLMPMSEELLYKDGKVFVMCESACKKYIFGNIIGARYCYSFNPFYSK